MITLIAQDFVSETRFVMMHGSIGFVIFCSLNSDEFWNFLVLIPFFLEFSLEGSKTEYNVVCFKMQPFISQVFYFADKVKTT